MKSMLSICISAAIVILCSCSGPVSPGRARIVSISATSTLTHPSDKYNVKSLVDGNVNTCWLEGVPGNGIGQSFTIRFDRKVELRRFWLLNGYNDSRYYYRNNRVKSLKVNDKVVTVMDHRMFQEVVLDTPVVSDSFTFAIDAVYRKFVDDDTVISEISFAENRALFDEQEKKLASESPYSNGMISRAWVNNASKCALSLKTDGGFNYTFVDVANPGDPSVRFKENKFSGRWSRMGDYIILDFKEKPERKIYLLTKDYQIAGKARDDDYLHSVEGDLLLSSIDLNY